MKDAVRSYGVSEFPTWILLRGDVEIGLGPAVEQNASGECKASGDDGTCGPSSNAEGKTSRGGGNSFNYLSGGESKSMSTSKAENVSLSSSSSPSSSSSSSSSSHAPFAAPPSCIINADDRPARLAGVNASSGESADTVLGRVRELIAVNVNDHDRAAHLTRETIAEAARVAARGGKKDEELEALQWIWETDTSGYGMQFANYGMQMLLPPERGDDGGGGGVKWEYTTDALGFQYQSSLVTAIAQLGNESKGVVWKAYVEEHLYNIQCMARNMYTEK